MVDIANTAILLGGPVVEAVRSVFGTASYVVGGIFGLYLILMLVRWWQDRIIVRLLKDVKFDLDQQNRKLKLPHSKELFQSKIYRKIGAIFEKKK